MPFKIDRASHIVGRKFTVFALFCFVFGGNFQVHAPWLIWLIFGGAIKRRDFALRVWGAFIWGVLYMDGLIFGVLRLTSRNTKR